VINSTVDGWITGVGKATTGSVVKKNETLATFYSPEFLSAVQALLFALNSMDRSQSGQMAKGQAQQDQMAQFGINLRQYKDSLRNLGMGERQVEEMIRTRQFMESVDITSPSDGILLARSVSPGQRFERGKELYRIADLSRVWILVDVYGAEVSQFKAGMQVRATLPSHNKSFLARVSAIPPIFDPASRTLKVRLELDNPGYQLRPDMFVNVELPVTLPPMLAVPAEAIIDSGLKKTVFVEKSAGIFEPREVETGRSFGNRVEIVSGLKAGERIAVSGTFLLDSESRMRTAAAGITGTAQQDPVCGMYVDDAKARAAGHIIEAGGRTNFFCSDDCKQKYMKNPAAKVLHSPAPAAKAKAAVPPAAHRHEPGMTMPEPAAAKPDPAKPGPDPHAGHAMPPAAPPMTHETGKKHD
jgi:RND family efflux transporter MFP subunit